MVERPVAGPLPPDFGQMSKVGIGRCPELGRLAGFRTKQPLEWPLLRAGDRPVVAGSDGWAVVPQSCRWHPGLEHEWQVTGRQSEFTLPARSSQ